MSGTDDGGVVVDFNNNNDTNGITSNIRNRGIHNHITSNNNIVSTDSRTQTSNSSDVELEMTEYAKTVTNDEYNEKNVETIEQKVENMLGLSKLHKNLVEYLSKCDGGDEKIEVITDISQLRKGIFLTKIDQREGYAISKENPLYGLFMLKLEDEQKEFGVYCMGQNEEYKLSVIDKKEFDDMIKIIFADIQTQFGAKKSY